MTTLLSGVTQLHFAATLLRPGRYALVSRVCCAHPSTKGVRGLANWWPASRISVGFGSRDLSWRVANAGDRAEADLAASGEADTYHFEVTSARHRHA